MSLNDAQEQNRLWYLGALGIEVWQLRGKASSSQNQNLTTWDELQSQVARCQACSLHKTRTQTVFGVGNRQADLLVIGEAPGQQEDLKGEPFVGRAGQLLDSMLKAINHNRQTVYIANILKCRPPNNRDPNPEETTQCTPFLVKQIEMLQPKLILAVGRIAAQYLLNSTVTIGKLRERQHVYPVNGKEIPLIVTYHPSYLLRSPQEKKKAYQDLLQVVRVLGPPSP